ncbi:galactose transporter [Trichomonascus vanleenenianus]|uniref:sugar porter family MFS transporter n=1 Tax=Trichomonascus vanleenenianus TaxID=2268995 RepID=UPI003ECB557B
MAFLTPKWYQFLVSCFAALGSFTYGYDLGVIAQVVASNSFISSFHPTSNESGAVVSLFTGGAFFGAFAAGFTSDLLGRRGTIVTATIMFVIGGIVQAGAQSLAYMHAGRFIAGFGVGIYCMIVPLYQAELCHPSIRGRVTALQQFFLGIGALVASWVGYGCYLGFGPTNNNQWRVPLGIQVIPAGILGLLIFFFPESPRWLIAKGKLEAGLKTLAKLHARDDTEDAFVKVQYAQICEEVELEKAAATHAWLELFKDKNNFRRVFLCTSIQAAIQMTGVSAIQYFSPTIFAQIGFSTGRTLLFQSINSIIALIAQAFCVLLIDYTGRRWVLISGMVGNSVMFIVATVLMAKFPAGTTNNRSAQIGFIASTWMYNFIFSACCGPLSWIIPAESFNLATRSKGVALSSMISFAFNTMIGQVTDKAMANVGYRYFYLFIVCNFTNALFFWAFLPETGKTPLELMDALWRDTPWFVPTAKMQKDYLGELNTQTHQLELKTERSHVEDEQHAESRENAAA